MSIVPENQTVNNTKVAKYISTNRDLVSTPSNLKNILLRTSEKTSKTDKYVLVNLFEDKNVSMSNPNITQDDKYVFDAVCSLYENGTSEFNAEAVIRTLYGNSKMEISPESIDFIKESLRKMSLIRIRIDTKNEEIKKRGAKSIVYESYLLPLGIVEVHLENGHVVSGYRIIEEPALYTYGKAKNHLITFPTALLETKRAARVSNEHIKIKRYLITRIRTMKNSKNNVFSNRICYSWFDKNDRKEKGAFRDLGYNPDDYKNWRNKRGKLHKMFLEALDDLVDKGEIVSYKIVKEKKAFNGFDIFF